MSRLKERSAEYCKALKQLQKAIAQPKNEFIRDAVIQRFEFTYELSWKTIKLMLHEEGIESATPRRVFQDALQAEFILDGNLWSAIQKQRNLTSHTYDELIAEQVYVFIVEEAESAFVELAEVIKNYEV